MKLALPGLKYYHQAIREDKFKTSKKKLKTTNFYYLSSKLKKMPSIDVVIISFLLVISIILTLINGVVILTQMNRFSKEEIAILVILLIFLILITVYFGLQLASLTEKDKARKKLLLKQTEGALWTFVAYVVIVGFLLLAYGLRKVARQDNGSFQSIFEKRRRKTYEMTKDNNNKLHYFEIDSETNEREEIGSDQYLAAVNKGGLMQRMSYHPY